MKLPEQLGSLIDEADVLVLHGGWRAANPWAAATARRAGVPYVITPHGRYDPNIYARHRTIEQRGGGSSNAPWWIVPLRCISSSKMSRPSCRGASRSSSLRTGSRPPRHVTWSGSTDGSLLWLGRLDPEHKGLDLLIDAVRSISPDERPSIDLYGHDWLGGRALVLDQIRRDGLERWIRLHDPIVGDAKWAALAAAKGFVYPSRWEAFGLALAEAVSIGTPSLATPFPLARFLASRGVVDTFGRIARRSRREAGSDGGLKDECTHERGERDESELLVAGRRSILGGAGHAPDRRAESTASAVVSRPLDRIGDREHGSTPTDDHSPHDIALGWFVSSRRGMAPRRLPVDRALVRHGVLGGPRQVSMTTA